MLKLKRAAEMTPNAYRKASVSRVKKLMRQMVSEEHNAIRDLLIDLRHYCDAAAIDFYGQLDKSYEPYLKERRGN